MNSYDHPAGAHMSIMGHLYVCVGEPGQAGFNIRVPGCQSQYDVYNDRTVRRLTLEQAHELAKALLDAARIATVSG